MRVLLRFAESALGREPEPANTADARELHADSPDSALGVMATSDRPQVMPGDPGDKAGDDGAGETFGPDLYSPPPARPYSFLRAAEAGWPAIEVGSTNRSRRVVLGGSNFADPSRSDIVLNEPLVRVCTICRAGHGDCSLS